MVNATATKAKLSKTDFSIKGILILVDKEYLETNGVLDEYIAQRGGDKFIEGKDYISLFQAKLIGLIK
jgi:hypothetical protein